MQEYDSLFRQFGNCMGSEFGSVSGCEAISRPNAQCCEFEVVNEESITGMFCITNEQRDGSWTGTYRDLIILSGNGLVSNQKDQRVVVMITKRKKPLNFHHSQPTMIKIWNGSFGPLISLVRPGSSDGSLCSHLV